MSNSRSVLFASWHLYLDRTNGASISTRELLLELVKRGWRVKTICCLAQDGREQLTLNELVERSGLVIRKNIVKGEYTFSFFNDGGIESLAFYSKTRRSTPSRYDRAVYLKLLKDVLNKDDLNLVLTYGSYALGPEILTEARRFGVKTCVFLHNLCYKERRYFQNADLVFTPSQFASKVYGNRLALDTVVVPPLLSFKKEPLDIKSRFNMKHILFVNPELGKGSCFFLALAKELWRIRPEIRFLAVEGREGVKSLLTLGKKFIGDAHNIDFVHNTDNMDFVYSQAKLTLIPSLYEETFGRVAAESLASGTPVVASSRGALPEVIGDSGTIIDIPPKFTIDRPLFPTAKEIEPWISASLRLWDDSVLYANTQQKGLERSLLWQYDSVADLYEKALLDLLQKK